MAARPSLGGHRRPAAALALPLRLAPLCALAGPAGAEAPAAADRLAVRGCALRICTPRGGSAPRLFVTDIPDGAGRRMAQIMDGIATAHTLEMDFGGVVDVTTRRSPYSRTTMHGVPFMDLVDDFFGPGASAQLYGAEAAPEHFRRERTFFSRQRLREARPSLPEGCDVLLRSGTAWIYDDDGVQPPTQEATQYYEPGLKTALREQLLLQPLAFAPRRPAVAIHMRRGDIGPDSFDARRVQPEEYYYRLVERIRKQVPSADVHVWSSVGRGMNKEECWASSDFDGLRSRNITVHLDEDGPLTAWAHMARAQVLVMSMSLFSYVPGIINPHCRVWPGPVDPLQRGWMDGLSASNTSQDVEFWSCFSAPPR